MVRPGSSKRSKMAGSPHQPAQHSHDSPAQQTPISPSLDDISPARSSHGKIRFATMYSLFIHLLLTLDQLTELLFHACRSGTQTPQANITHMEGG